MNNIKDTILISNSLIDKIDPFDNGTAENIDIPLMQHSAILQFSGANNTRQTVLCEINKFLLNKENCTFKLSLDVVSRKEPDLENIVKRYVSGEKPDFKCDFIFSKIHLQLFVTQLKCKHKQKSSKLILSGTFKHSEP